MHTVDPKEILQKIELHDDAHRFNLHETHLLLGIAYPTVARYVKRGLLKSINIGGRKFITVAEIRRFLLEGNSPNMSDIDDTPTNKERPSYAT